MRLAIISDIHGNLEALDAVIRDIGTQSVDEIVCLGDIVGYGANPNECTDLVSVILLGNHDAAAVGTLSTHYFNIHAKIAIEWTAENLTKATVAYLQSLPTQVKKEQSTLVHATPYEPEMWYYITSLEEAAFNFQFFDTRFCFVGHTHIPIIIVLDKEKELYVHQDTVAEFGSLAGCRFLINVGSVGQPRDRNPNACYGILDTNTKQFAYRRVAYDVAGTQEAMRNCKLPEFLITRLADGR
jgi:predicted phosphodiesterase